jgi:hypothetical protein
MAGNVKNNLTQIKAAILPVFYDPLQQKSGALP